MLGGSSTRDFSMYMRLAPSLFKMSKLSAPSRFSGALFITLILVCPGRLPVPPSRHVTAAPAVHKIKPSCDAVYVQDLSCMGKTVGDKREEASGKRCGMLEEE